MSNPKDFPMNNETKKKVFLFSEDNESDMRLWNGCISAAISKAQLSAIVYGEERVIEVVMRLESLKIK